MGVTTIFAEVAPAGMVTVRLEGPLLGAAVMLAQPAVKLARDAADGRLVADVRLAQSAGAESAQMPAKLGEDDRFAHPGGLHRRCNSGRRAAVDADVGINELPALDRPTADPQPQEREAQRGELPPPGPGPAGNSSAANRQAGSLRARNQTGATEPQEMSGLRERHFCGMNCTASATT
jgi:hypothetical protein